MTKDAAATMWAEQIEVVDKLDKHLNEMFGANAQDAEAAIRQLLWDNKVGLIRAIQSLRPASQGRQGELIEDVLATQIATHLEVIKAMDCEAWCRQLARAIIARLSGSSAVQKKEPQ